MNSERIHNLPKRIAIAGLWLFCTVLAYVAFPHLSTDYGNTWIWLLVAPVMVIAYAGPFMALNALLDVIKLPFKTWLIIGLCGSVFFWLSWLGCIYFL